MLFSWKPHIKTFLQKCSSARTYRIKGKHLLRGDSYCQRLILVANGLSEMWPDSSGILSRGDSSPTNVLYSFSALRIIHIKSVALSGYFICKTFLPSTLSTTIIIFKQTYWTLETPSNQKRSLIQQQSWDLFMNFININIKRFNLSDGLQFNILWSRFIK